MAAVIRRGGNSFYRDKKGFESSNPSIKNANPSFSYPIDRKETPFVSRTKGVFFNEIHPVGWAKSASLMKSLA